MNVSHALKQGNYENHFPVSSRTPVAAISEVSRTLGQYISRPRITTLQGSLPLTATWSAEIQ